MDETRCDTAVKYCNKNNKEKKLWYTTYRKDISKINGTY
jgi:hypothetical protein